MSGMLTLISFPKLIFLITLIYNVLAKYRRLEIEGSYNDEYTKALALCPVSGMIHSSIDGFHSYPNGIYDFKNTSTFTSISTSITKSKFVVNCTSCESSCTWNNDLGDYSSLTFHQCKDSDDNRICPIQKKFLDIAANVTKSTLKGRLPLCLTSMAITDSSKTINLYFLGGSLTLGRDADGCCCNPEVDSICAKLFPRGCNYREYKGQAPSKGACSWVIKIIRWLRSIGPASFNVINLAADGRGSQYLTDNNFISEYKFSRYDIVFLDYSCNDASFFGRVEEKKLTSQVENVIRIISRQSIDIVPAIILLETYPYKAVIRHKVPPSSDKVLYDYSNAYRRVAEYYNITLWSYRDVVWSSSLEESLPQLGREYLRFERNTFLLHIPWHAHLFYADLIGALILQSFRDCSKLLSTIDHKGMNTTEVEELLISNNYLHQSYSSNRKEMSHTPVFACSSSYPMLINLQAKDYYKGTTAHAREAIAQNDNSHRSRPQAGSYYTNPFTDWPIYIDRHIPGWIQTSNNSRKDISELFFVSDPSFITNAVPKLHNTQTGTKLLLSIEYLRTYRNAGFAVVYRNNSIGVWEKVIRINALWSNYEEKTVSIPQWEHATINLYSNKELEAPLVIKIEYHNDQSSWCKNNVPSWCASKAMDSARQPDYKLKIISIHTCVYE